MPIRPPEFDEVAYQLAPLLKDLPGKLIAIDGRMCSGKTTLGRFLSWYFNVTLIETDLFLLGNGTFERRTDEIGRMVTGRLDRSSPRPVIVEGVAILELLEQLGRPADAHVYVENTSNPVEPSAPLLSYEARFSPLKIAPFHVKLAHEG